MTPERFAARVKEEALALGFDLVGVAKADRVADDERLAEWLARGRHGTMAWMAGHFDKRVDPRALLPGCRSIVSVALVYQRPAQEAPAPDGLRVARYAWGEDYHRILKDKLHALLERGRAIDPGFEGRAFVDSAPVMDKYWAERAGIGWRGKHTNVLNKRLGSWFFLGEILTTAELAPDEPGTDHCGTCTRCIDACPTGAIVAPYDLDATRCISYWTIEHRDALAPAEEEAVGEWLFGCDVCQEVCPWNKDAAESREPRLAPRAEAWPASLDDLLALTPGEFRDRFGDTAIERTRRRGLVRNAAIVAGNRGRGSDAALERAAADPDPVVAGSARRAIEKRARMDGGHAAAGASCDEQPVPTTTEASRGSLRYGLLGGALLAGLLFVQQAVLGRSPFGEPGEWGEVWVALVHCIGFAYFPAAYVGTLRSGRRAAAELGVEAGEDGTLEGMALPPFDPPGRGFLLAGLTGVFAVLLGPWLAEPGAGAPWYFWAPQGWSPEVYWHRVLGIGIGLFGGWYALAVFRVSRRFSRLARRLEVRDVFDPAPLRPFTRLGLTNGLTAAGIATFVGLLGLDLGLTMMLAVFGGISLALVSVATMLPVLGVRDRMRSAKDAELAWCDAAIARQRGRVRSGEGDEDGSRLTSLVTYRELVGDIRTWPFDTAALRRVVFYLLIPLVSWTASAVVEAFVERWMRG